MVMQMKGFNSQIRTKKAGYFAWIWVSVRLLCVSYYIIVIYETGYCGRLDLGGIGGQKQGESVLD